MNRLLRRSLIAITTIVVILYLGISTYAALVVTTPRRAAIEATPATYGASFENVRFPARGGDAEIAGWFLPSSSADRAIILVHGKDSNKSRTFSGHFPELAANLVQRGFHVLMIDLRGHGTSGPGRFSFGLDERRDLLGAVDWLATQGIPAERVGILGVSMGAASAIGAAHDDPRIAAVVSDCSYAEVYPLMQMHWSRTSGLPDAFLPSTLLIGDLLLGKDLTQARPVGEVDLVDDKPLLIIHGLNDSFTPIEQGRQLAAAAPLAEYWEVAGADHAESYSVDPVAYTERVSTFFAAAIP
ncbi:MAG: alpha/beta hydrolase [Roseiflexaceae bacterium]